MGIVLNCIKASNSKITTFESNKHVINEDALDFLVAMRIIVSIIIPHLVLNMRNCILTRKYTITR